MGPTLTYETVPVGQLTVEQVTAWNTLTQTNVELASPFFRSEYTQQVAEVRGGIEVCVIRDRNEIAGLFPFERLDRHVGRPVGGSMSNFQGVIANAATPWDALKLTRAARVKTLTFHHQIQEQRQFDRYTGRRVESPVIDVSRGWDAYLSARAQAGVSSFNALPRKMRKLEKEIGPVTFGAHTASPDVFERLVSWKRAQYQRTNSRGSLSHDWGVEVIRRLVAIQGPEFSGTLSELYAGDRLIAAHAGMRTATAWHYWFPAYDPDVGQYSPGLVLMFEMVRWASGSGMRYIDLGPGAGAHKELFATSERHLGVGQVVVPSLADALQRFTGRIRSIGK